MRSVQACRNTCSVYANDCRTNLHTDLISISQTSSHVQAISLYGLICPWGIFWIVGVSELSILISWWL